MNIIILLVSAVILVVIYIIYSFYTKTNNNLLQMEKAKKELVNKVLNETQKSESLDAKYNTCNTDKDGLQSQINKYEMDVKALNDNITQKQTAMEAVENKYNTCNTDKDALQSQINKYETDVKALNDNITQKQTAMEAVENTCNTDKDGLQSRINKYETDAKTLNDIITQKQAAIVAVENDYNIQKGISAKLRNTVGNNWEIYKGANSYVVARLNKDSKNNILYECLATDGKNCFWRQSYDDAMNDLNNIPSNLNTVLGNWEDIVPVDNKYNKYNICNTDKKSLQSRINKYETDVKALNDIITQKQAAIVAVENDYNIQKGISAKLRNNIGNNWEIYKGADSHVVARLNKDSKNNILYECLATDGKNCFWKGSYNDAMNDLNNIPSNINPVLGNWDILPVDNKYNKYNICNTDKNALQSRINNYEIDAKTLNDIIVQNRTAMATVVDNFNKQKELSTKLQNSIGNNWAIYKGDSSYVVARLNKTPETSLYECLATDGKNCLWKTSYDLALNDLNNLPSNINPASGNWLDLKVTSPPKPEPWKVCKASSTGDYFVARNDTGSFGKASECATSDGKNCFWRKDKNAVNDYLNNLSPSTSIPLKGNWGDLQC
jgi:predicted  nucleic acid-binding Zn-ribbon protein